MARIIFSIISGLPNSNKLPCFYEGFTNALSREGNEVLVIVNNKLIKNHWNDNISVSKLNKKKLDEEIIKFNPDLVITANNSLYENIPTLVDCPIAIYCTDSPSGFTDRDILKQKVDRYHIFLPSKSMIPMAREYYGHNMKSLEVVQFATDFMAKDVTQDKNISFIGTNFNFAGTKFKDIFYDEFGNQEYRDNFIKFIDLFKKDVLRMPDSIIKELNLDPGLLKSLSHIEILNLFSSNFRIQTLAAIADLGLSLYGSKSWYDISDYSLDTALSYVDKEISTMSDNEEIYNSSKISINISHSQAGGAFSWRVRDVMACNSALVSDYREDIVTEFGKYVKIPMFDNAFDARVMCQKLLSDEVWRKELVAGSRLAIEEEHRFKHRIEQIQNIVGVELLPEGKEGSLRFLNPDDFIAGGNKLNINIMKKEGSLKPAIVKPAISRLKLFIYGMTLSFYSIPVIGKRLVSQKKSRKIIQKLNKNIAA